jgi:IS5 family transposase
MPIYTMMALGERESVTKRLEEAVEAYRATLQERTRERVPLQWATTQDNLGNALETLGVRTHDRTKLKEARKAVDAAFEGFVQAGQQQYRRYFEDRLR